MNLLTTQQSNQNQTTQLLVSNQEQKSTDKQQENNIDLSHSSFNNKFLNPSGDDEVPTLNQSGFHDFSKISILPPRQIPVQPKLNINAPNDKYEQEADRVAEQVMRMPEPGVQRKCTKCGKEEVVLPASDITIQRKCAGCEEEEMIQTKSNRNSVGTASTSLMNQIQSTRGRGKALDNNTRSFMESRFGADFSGVKIHADSQAAEMSQGINAKAFTVGKNIYFNRSQYNTCAEEGKRLLAHELVHTIQQSSSLVKQNGTKTSANLQIKSRSIPGLIQRKTVIILAGGYKGYKSEKAEAQQIKSGLSWLPSTVDFTKTAYDTQSSNVFQAKEAGHFFGALDGKTNISRIVFIGHGHSSGLGLSGSTYIFSKSLDSSDLPKFQSYIDNKIKPNLKKNATIDLYACNVAAGKTFIKDLAKAFDRPVRGFSSALLWCIQHDAAATKITSRGKIAAKRPKGDCSAKGWYKGVNKLKPPKVVKP